MEDISEAGTMNIMQYYNIEGIKYSPSSIPLKCYKYFMFEYPCDDSNGTSPPRRLTNDLVFPFREVKLQTKSGFVNPTFAFLLEDEIWNNLTEAASLPVVDIVVSLIHRESGVGLFQANARFSLVESSETANSSLFSSAEDSINLSTGDDSQKKSLSLFAKRIRKSGDSMGAKELSQKPFDCKLVLNTVFDYNLPLLPFQLEDARTVKIVPKELFPQFITKIAVFILPFSLTTLKNNGEIILLQSPFQQSIVANNDMNASNIDFIANRPRLILGERQRSPYLFASVVDLQLTQDIIDLHRHKKLLVTVSYICEANRTLMLHSSYLGCIYNQNGEWVTRSEIFCANEIKSEIIKAMNSSNGKHFLGNPMRPDLIRVDLFLLNPNEKTPPVSTADIDLQSSSVANASGMNAFEEEKGREIDTSLYRVRLFSGRLESAIAFSQTNQIRVNSELKATTNTLQSSFGNDARVTISEYLLDIPLFVASPNKVKESVDVVPRQIIARSPPRGALRAPIPGTDTGTVHHPTDALRSRIGSTAGMGLVGAAPVKKLMVGRVSLRLEVVCEDRIPGVDNGQDGSSHLPPSLIDTIAPETSDPEGEFVASIVDDWGRFVSSDAIFQSDYIRTSIASMGIATVLQTLQACSARHQLLHDNPVAQVNNTTIEATSRLMRLTEHLLFRLSNEKELVDESLFPRIIDQFEQGGVSSLLWDYFQYWLTTDLSKELIAKDDDDNDDDDVVCPDLSNVQWESLRAVCLTLRLLNFYFSSKIAISQVTDPAYSSNVEISLTLSQMAQELFEGILSYGYRMMTTIEKSCRNSVAIAQDVFSLSIKPTEMDSVKVRNSLEVEYVRVIDTEIDEFMNAGVSSTSGKDSKKLSSSWDKLLTVKMAASKMVKNQKYSKFRHAFETLSRDLVSHAEKVDSLLSQIYSSISIILDATLIPIATNNLIGGLDSSQKGISSTSIAGDAISTNDENMLGMVDPSALLLLSSLIEKNVSVMAIAASNIIPPTCASSDNRPQLGYPEMQQIRKNAFNSSCQAMSLLTKLIKIYPHLFASLDESHKFLMSKSARQAVKTDTVDSPGHLITHAIIALVKFCKEYLIPPKGLHGGSSGGGEDGSSSTNTIINNIKSECSSRYLSTCLTLMISVILEAISAPLAIFDWVVPNLPKQEVYMPPSATKRKKTHIPHTATALSATNTSTFSPSKLEHELNNSRGVASPGSPMRAGASLNALSSPGLGFRGAGSSGSRFGNTVNLGNTATSTTSTLGYLRSLQVEAEKPPEPVLAITGGGVLYGEDAICYLGKKFELLQAVQYCVDVCINVSFHETKQADVDDNKMAMHVLEICRQFIYYRVFNALTQGKQTDSDALTALYEFFGNTTSTVSGRCFAQLLTYIACFTTTWWSKWFSILTLAEKHASENKQDKNVLTAEREAMFSCVSPTTFISILKNDAKFLSHAALVSLYRINVDSSLDIEVFTDYLGYISGISAIDANLSMPHKKDSCSTISEWMKFRGSLLGAIISLVKAQLLYSDKLLKSLGLTVASNINTNVAAPLSNDASKLLVAISEELPHSIALLQDLSSLEPLVDHRPDVVLLCLDFEYNQLEPYHNAPAASQSSKIKESTSTITPIYDQQLCSGNQQVSYYVYPSNTERTQQKRVNFSIVHQFDAIAVLGLLLDLASLVPVLTEAASKSLDSASIGNQSANGASISPSFKLLLAPIISSRDTVLLTTLYILKIFSPGQDSHDVETALKYQALESTFLAMLDRFILGSLPLTDSVIMKLIPNIKYILNMGQQSYDYLIANKFYSPNQCSTVISSIVYVLCSQQADSHWFPRLELLRHHFVRKLNALHWFVANNLFAMELESRRNEVDNSFHIQKYGIFEEEEEDSSDINSAQSKIDKLLSNLTLAVKRKAGPILRLEDKLGVKAILGPKKALTELLESLPKTMFFSLRRRYSNMIEAAILSAWIHEQGFGHGVFAKPIGGCSSKAGAKTGGIHRLTSDAFHQLSYITRNRFWRTLSIQNLLNYLHNLLLFRIDLKHKTDIRLVGSETSYNYLLADTLSGGAETRRIEARRRLLDSYTGVACDPIEKFGFGALGGIMAAKLAMHFSICSLIADDKNLFANQYPTYNEVDAEYKTHTNYEHILEHGGQMAREISQNFLRIGEWETGIDVLTELQSFYKQSSLECVAEAKFLSEDLHSIDYASNELRLVETEVDVNTSAGRNLVEQLDELRRHQRHGYCLDHYRRNCALLQEMLRSKDKFKERANTDSRSRPHSQFYAIRLFPNPFAPPTSTEPGVAVSSHWPAKLLPFFDCTGLPCHVTLPVTHRKLHSASDHENSFHADDIDDDASTAEIKHYLDAELLLDPVDSLGHDRPLWLMLKADPTSFMASSELYSSFSCNENRAREKGDIKENSDRLPVFLPPSCYHAIEAQLCAAFPEYRIVSPMTHLDIGSNVRNDHKHGRILDKTIQIFEAFPEVMCEDPSLANDLLSEQERSGEYGDEENEQIATIGHRMSISTSKIFDEEFQYEEEVDRATRSKVLWERATNSTRFYVFAYENPQYSFQSLLNTRVTVSEQNIDPVIAQMNFADEYGTRLLRYTLETSAFNTDFKNVIPEPVEEEDDGFMEDEFGDFRNDDTNGELDDNDDNADVTASVKPPRSSGGKQKYSGSKTVFPGMHSLTSCAWLSPALFCTIRSVRRMDPIKACTQVCNAQLIVSHDSSAAILQLSGLSTADLLSQPAGDIVTGPSLLVATLSNMSNVVVSPSSCAVGLHSAKLLIAAEIDRREKVFQSKRKYMKRRFMRERAEYESGIRYDPPEELSVADLQREHEHSEEAVQLITLQLLCGLLTKHSRQAVDSMKTYYAAHIGHKTTSRQQNTANELLSQRSLVAPTPQPEKRTSSRFKSVERFGMKPTTVAEQSIEATIHAPSAVSKLGASKEDMEEEQLIWMELILWIDAHLSAHTTGYAL